MNENALQINEELLSYQSQRLRSLILEILQCCEGRKLFESEKFGLPYSELKCLMLFDGEHYLTSKGIAQRMDVAKSRVTKIINGLAEKGLVIQINDPEDARIRLIKLTREGRKKSDEIAAFEQEIHQKILLQISPEERNKVISQLEILRVAMEAVKEQLV
jgi:DNA-binding MarR family transcriptional regulator